MTLHGTFGHEFLAITWSLAIEEQFYLFLPWLIRVTPPRRLPLVTLALLGLPTVLRATFGGDGKFYGFVLTPWRLDALFFGVGLALIERSPRLMARLRRHAPLLGGFFCAQILAFLYLTFAEPLGTLRHFFFLALMYTTLLAWVLSTPKGRGTQWLQHPWLRHIGILSYGIYLFHQTINGLLHYWILHSPPRFQDPPSILLTFLAAGTTYLVAWASYHAYEKRCIAWGHRWTYA